MGPAQAIRTCLAKSFQFSGRASRSEFWWFFALWAAVMISLVFLVSWTYNRLPSHLPTIIAWKSLKASVVLVFLLPLGAIARRHHDAGFTAFLAFLAAIPGLVSIINALIFIPALLGVDMFFALPLIHWQPTAFVAFFVLLALSSLAALWPSQPGPNSYGPNPLEVTK